jgi:hypothetical protein
VYPPSTLRQLGPKTLPAQNVTDTTADIVGQAGNDNLNIQWADYWGVNFGYAVSGGGFGDPDFSGLTQFHPAATLSSNGIPLNRCTPATDTYKLANLTPGTTYAYYVDRHSYYQYCHWESNWPYHDVQVCDAAVNWDDPAKTSSGGPEIAQFTTTGVAPPAQGSVTSDGSGATVGLHCTAAFVCTGATHLDVISAGPRRARPTTTHGRVAATVAARVIMLGRATFKIPAHATRTVRIHFTSQGRKLMRKHRRLRVTQFVTMRIPHHKAVTTSSKLTLRRR